jgi:MFS transporter, OCT family, solute carrier family 22 (organic cation transporter), member 4/5
MMPTIIRSGSVGAFTTFSRFVGLAAPFVPLLAIFSQILPLLVFGVFAFMAGMLAIFLPETLGRKLPDTIQDAEDIG